MLPPPGPPPVLVPELPDVVVAVPELPDVPMFADVLPEAPAEPEFVLRLRVLVVENEFPSLSFQVMIRGTDERSFAVKVTSKLEKSSDASDPIA
jgi:hypothetical protein